MTSGFSFGIFKLFKLPLAFFARIKISSLDSSHSCTTIKYSWITTNPFKSIYFAVLAMAAELSSGALAMLSIEGTNESIAMLVVESNGKYYKKATGRINFICNDGQAFQDIIKECVETNQPSTLKSHIIAQNESGEMVCEFYFTWSFKKRG
jgi:hypothetical protein